MGDCFPPAWLSRTHGPGRLPLTHAHFWFLPEEQWDWTCVRALWACWKRCPSSARADPCPTRWKSRRGLPDGALPQNGSRASKAHLEGIMSGASTGVYAEYGPAAPKTAPKTALDELSPDPRGRPTALANRLSFGVCMGTCPPSIALGFGQKLDTEGTDRQTGQGGSRATRTKGKPCCSVAGQRRSDLPIHRSPGEAWRKSWKDRLRAGPPMSPRGRTPRPGCWSKRSCDDLWLINLRSELQGRRGKERSKSPATAVLSMGKHGSGHRVVVGKPAQPHYPFPCSPDAPVARGGNSCPSRRRWWRWTPRSTFTRS